MQANVSLNKFMFRFSLSFALSQRARAQFELNLVETYIFSNNENLQSARAGGDARLH